MALPGEHARGHYETESAGNAAIPNWPDGPGVLLGIRFGKSHFTLPTFGRQANRWRHRLHGRTSWPRTTSTGKSCCGWMWSGERLLSKLGHVIWP